MTAVPSPESTSSLEVRLARTPAERLAAQRLRYEVFNLHAGLGLASSHTTGIDADEFDPACDHLLALAGERVVGTYRLLPDHRRPPQGFYNETAFDLSGLRAQGWRLLELDRSCVDPTWRDGSVIRALLRGLVRYQRESGADALFGAVSVTGFDPIEITGIHQWLMPTRVTGWPLARPLEPFPLPPEEAARQDPAVFWSLPPLFKGYLRLGARVAGPPAMDRDFGTTDFLMVLPIGAGAAAALRAA